MEKSVIHSFGDGKWTEESKNRSSIIEGKEKEQQHDDDDEPNFIQDSAFGIQIPDCTTIPYAISLRHDRD
jgi:hypothetical protein